MDECWRLILELGTRWPPWNGTMASQATLGVKKENDGSTLAVADGGHHLQGRQPDAQQQEQDFLKLLAARALEALAAQAPPGRVARPARGGMLAPKQITRERLDIRVATGDALKAPRISTPPTLPVYQQPTSLAKAPTSSREMPAPKPTSTRPRTAELTIFYDGTVNVCNNVPADKAHLIMMYAEKAGLPAQGGSFVHKTRFVPPSSGASPQVTYASDAGPSQKGFQPDSNSSKVAVTAGPSSSVHCDPARSVSHVEGSTSEPANENVDCAMPVAQVDHGKTPMPAKVTVTTLPANPPRQLRQNVTPKPLPYARRNSLARFLDSRKKSRLNGPTSEELSPKKLAIGEGGPSDADDLKGNENQSVPSKDFEEDSAMGTSAVADRGVVDQAADMK